jgi:hypothetical protein
MTKSTTISDIPLDKTTANKLTASELEQTWPTFSRQILDFIAELKLDKLALHCDHVALRVNAIATAEALKNYFAAQGRIISNNIINGRPIVIIELDTPLQLGEMSIECVELPYPGDKRYPIEGWEHIELILPCEAQTCEELQQELMMAAPPLARLLAEESEVMTENGAITVKRSSPKGEHERLPNPTIAFKRDHLCIKVHSHGIKAVIASETN